MGRGREPWEWSEAGGVNDNKQTQMKSGSPSRTTAAHKTQTKIRSSSVGLETGEWRRCRSLSFTPLASLRSHGSRPRPTRHINNTGVGGNGSHSSGSGTGRDFPPVFSWDWDGKRLIFVGRERFENSLPCHPLDLQHTPTHTTCHALHFNTVQLDYTHTLH